MIRLIYLVAFAGFSAIPLVAQAQSYPVRSIQESPEPHGFAFPGRGLSEATPGVFLHP